ncbi:respiratory nitrate reductase 1 subunit gamma [Citrobacter koseri]|uniref:Nitrate reductase molybdenum cofactor assembly chaperone NarJ n=2 Tax=Enterobacteriaceae TaxID=543 RepID=A0A447UFY9_CITKO|nr:respiratory nitrate reductase 1 subunit gamma [Citrobacter koseri]
MIELVIVSRLLEYPDAALWQHQQELFDALASSENLDKEDAQSLAVFLRDLTAQEMLDVQASYSELFDRGRATSLLLFEHVHGESRDRGQAMVDLMAQYEQHGLQLDSRELPDHLPLYLEYLAQLPKNDALGGLQDIAPILALLGARLQQRESRYAVLFDLLLKLANTVIDSDKVAEKIADEVRDDTPQALDAVWEEEQVKFFAEQGLWRVGDFRSPASFCRGCRSAIFEYHHRRTAIMHFLNMFFFDIYPYIAGSVFLIGSWLRYDYGQYTWRAASSQMLDRKGMNLASNLFHFGILGIFAGHFLGMLTPHWMYEAFLPIEVKQKMAMIAGGACGVMTLVGGVLLLKRRLFSPRVRATTTGADILILSLLVIQCALGLLTIPFSAQHMDGSEMMKLVGWAQSVVTFHGGASEHLEGVAFIFRLHLVLGMTLFLLFPFLAPGSHLERAGRVPDA